MLKKLSIWLLLVLAFILLAGCHSPALEGEINDDLGRPINISKIPQRIVSLSPSNTEILFALGLADKVVGVTNFCDYPPQAKGKEKVGGFANPDIEKIIILSPDLVLVTGVHQNLIPKLAGRGLTVVALAPKTLDDVLKGISLVGKITGTDKEASRLVGDMRNRIDKVVNKTENLPQDEKPRVFYLTWHGPLWTVGSGTLEDELIQKAGGISIADDAQGHYVVDFELVLERNPQVIIASTGHGQAEDLPYKWVKTEPRLKSTEARKSDRIYRIDADLITRPGPRIIEGLECLACFIHPDVPLPK